MLGVVRVKVVDGLLEQGITVYVTFDCLQVSSGGTGASAEKSQRTQMNPLMDMCAVYNTLV